MTRTAMASSLLALSCAPATDLAEEELELSSVTQAAISSEVFRCDSGDPAIQLLCEAALTKVNAKLDEANIDIDQDGVLYTYENHDNIKVDTGHSCTKTAKVTDSLAQVRFKRGAKLDFSGDSLIEPLAVAVSLPVNLKVDMRVKEEHGLRVFGKCTRTDTDSYHLRGDLDTTADLAVGFMLNPSLGETPDGDLALVLEPEVTVIPALKSIDVKLEASGVNIVSQTWGAIVSTSSSILKGVSAGLLGNSLREHLNLDQLGIDLLVPLALGTSVLPRPLEDAVWDALSDEAEDRVDERVEEQLKYVRAELEQKLEKEVARALELDANGRRVIPIKRAFVDILRRGGDFDDIIEALPIDESIACVKEVSRVCSGCRGSCTECSTLARHCSELAQDYKEATRVLNEKPSKPRIQTLREEEAARQPTQCEIASTTCASAVQSCRESIARSPGYRPPGDPCASVYAQCMAGKGC